MKWLRARLSEASTYGGLAGLCLVACFGTFTFWPPWRYFGWAAGAFFVLQAIIAEGKHGNPR